MRRPILLNCKHLKIITKKDSFFEVVGDQSYKKKINKNSIGVLLHERPIFGEKITFSMRQI